MVCCDDGPETVYAIGADQHLAAAFYRNSIIHHFLAGSIAQLALISAAEPGVADPFAELWHAALRWRELLKFEFFFREKGEFRAAVATELKRNDEGWQGLVEQGPDGIGRLLRRFRPLTAHLTLRSFVEAYSVVAQALESLGAEGAPDDRSFLIACEGLGRQLLLQKRIHSPESVSRHLFQTGLQLASNSGLVAPSDDVAPRRRCVRPRDDALAPTARQHRGDRHGCP